MQRRVDEARELLVGGGGIPEIVAHLRRRFGVAETVAQADIKRAFEDMRARDAICPDASISRLMFQERLLAEFRALESVSRKHGKREPNVHAVRARVEIAERLADLDGVRPRDPDGDSGGGFTLVLDLGPDPEADGAA